jgi:hypothetical protein
MSSWEICFCAIDIEINAMNNKLFNASGKRKSGE